MEIEVVLELLHPEFSCITVSTDSIAKKYVVRADLRRPSSRSRLWSTDKFFRQKNTRAGPRYRL